MVTYGQPRVGDREYALKTIDLLGGIGASPEETRCGSCMGLSSHIAMCATMNESG